MRWKMTKFENNSNWFYKLGFRNGLQAIIMLISWIAWVRSLCDNDCLNEVAALNRGENYCNYREKILELWQATTQHGAT